MRRFKVLVIGDIMRDVYHYVKSNRIAQEANIPVWDEIRVERRLGGAANVANNLKAIGKDEIDVYISGICCTAFHADLIAHGINVDMLNEQSKLMGFTNPLMCKHRYIDESNKIIFRADNMTSFDIEHVYEHSEWIIGMLRLGTCCDFDSIIISDYDKGTITKEIVASIRGINLIVDSKRADVSMFDVANILKVNQQEYNKQTENSLALYKKNLEQIFPNIVITKGREGAELHTRQIIKYYPVDDVKVADVTGCGDTHTAALTYAMLKNKNIEAAIKFANVCASNVVQKLGTSTI